MVFWKKSKDKNKEELEALKREVEGELPPPPPPMPPETLPEAIQKRVSLEAPPGAEPQELAPLFVKIDRYEEVLDRLEEIKNILQKLTKLLSLYNQSDEVKADIADVLKETVSRITDNLIALDEVFIRPEGYRPEVLHRTRESEVEEHIMDLQEEMGQLKKELGRIE